MEQRRLKFLLLFLSFIFLILLAEGVYYWRLTGKTPKGLPRLEIFKKSEITKSEEYLAIKDIPVFEIPKGSSPFGYLAAGKRFWVLEQKNGWLNIKNERGSMAWVREDETVYKRQGEE